MSTWSVSFSYRLGLAFHALNNEGSDGSNLMQPRRIDVGRTTYDGISGEIVRRHILENLVSICRRTGINMLTASRALHPDRGPLGLREVTKQQGHTALDINNVFEVARAAIEKCAIVDIGGYLAAFPDKESGGGIPEKEFLKEIAQITKTPKQKKPPTVKRDSVFDVAWLISEEPQDLTITQHAAYRPTGDQSLFSQSMRSNTYAGVIRADLHRVGTDDYWYIHGKKTERDVLTPQDKLRRQQALVQAIVDYLASPTGAKTAGWAPHVFKVEGVILLTSARTAPFVSPIRVDLSNPDGRAICPDPSYRAQLLQLKNEKDTWAWEFQDISSLLSAGQAALSQLEAT